MSAIAIYQHLRLIATPTIVLAIRARLSDLRQFSRLAGYSPIPHPAH
jgi:hypothetical protein